MEPTHATEQEGLLLHPFVEPPTPEWGDFCWHYVEEDRDEWLPRCGWERHEHQPIRDAETNGGKA